MFPVKWMADAAFFIIGICSGLLIAGGMFAFVTMIGVVSRMAAVSKTMAHAMLYEDCVVVGAAIGNIFIHYRPVIGFGWMSEPVLAFFGFFAGIYIGCLAIALAELLNVVPIFSKRINLHRGFAAFVIAFSIGKFIGAFVDFFL